MSEKFDRVVVSDLTVKAVIGVWDWEREIEQMLLIDLMMETDIRAAAKSDALADALNYQAVSESITEYVQNAKPKLIEVLAEGIADLVLALPAVTAVDVTVKKPGALPAAGYVAVSIRRQSKA